MSRFAAVAIVVAVLAVPAFAQHGGGGGHAGFSGHAGGAPRGGFSAPSGGRFAAPSRPSAPFRYGSPRYAPSGPMRYGPGNFRSGYPMNPSARYGYPGQRPIYRGSVQGYRGGSQGSDNHRHSYIRVYNNGYPFARGFFFWPGYPTVLDYGYGDYGGYGGYDDSGDAQSYAPSNDYGDYGNQGDYGYGYDYGQNYGQGQGSQYDYPDQPPPQQWPSLGPDAQQYPRSQQPVALASSPEAAVTLVFKDGRTEMVHNYVLTQRSIFVGDSRGVTIPMDQLDVAKTEQANQDAGVDFHLPQALN